MKYFTKYCAQYQYTTSHYKYGHCICKIFRAKISSVLLSLRKNWVTSSNCLVIAQNKKYTLRTTVQLLKFAYNCFTIFIVVQKEAKNRENESILYIPYKIGCI